MVLDVHGQTVFKEGADLTPVRPVAIANGEEVAVLEAHNVRVSNVCILIDLVWVVSGYASFGGKREFCDYVDNFVPVGR